ncbi:MAG: threonine synthase [Oscillospiraceae bacterium]|jgi:threonine synthase|nr:threonine synthase [Oscillospiraceae bacterium]
MLYTSTRNNNVRVESASAIARGISADGGLYVSTEIPRISTEEFEAIAVMTYNERAAYVLSKFLTDFTAEELSKCVADAYTGKFGGENIAPIESVNNSKYVLELWHGPTCAFKDMALQLLPHLLKTSVRKISDGREIVILVATSGDTGKAALEGFKDVDGTKIIVFYPEDGVSNIQKLQMVTQEGGNVGVCAVKGNFDDCQTGVKKIFTDPAIAEVLSENNMAFSSANSINWGRLAPQIVYYISAYADMMNNGEIDYDGEKVNIVVPTGNFGNILAAYYAKLMGLPVGKLICASNENNVLTDFINTGVYDRNRAFRTTMSPSMDILISSNLERLLFHLSGGDSERVSRWMHELSTTGRYEVDDDVKQQLSEMFCADFCNDESTQAAIREEYQSDGYLIDTHTAVAFSVYDKYVAATGDAGTPAIIVSTASPYKFSESVLGAVSEEILADNEFDIINELSVVSGTPIPAPLLNLRGKEVRFGDVCTAKDMKAQVFKMLGVENNPKTRELVYANA